MKKQRYCKEGETKGGRESLEGGEGDIQEIGSEIETGRESLVETAREEERNLRKWGVRFYLEATEHILQTTIW